MEIAGLISDRMKGIDNDVKKLQDDMTEVRNNYAQLVKKEGNNFLTQDIAAAIYSSSKNLDPSKYFVEVLGSEQFSTVIAIVHKSKEAQFKGQYEKIIQWSAQSGIFGAVPKSAASLDIEDNDGNQLWRLVVFKDKVDEYLVEGRKQGLVLRKFVYDYEAYKKELQVVTELDSKLALLKTQLATKTGFAFSELMIALLHLKVLRAFIDGVLRFGIPPKFYIGIIEPIKGQEKAILANLNDRFDDKSLAGMYGTSGGKDSEGGIGESGDDFFSFVSIPLTTPMTM